MPADGLAVAHALFAADRLTQARELRGLLKQELAHQVDVTPAAIGQYERGVTRPRPAVVARLALALGVPPAFFAGDRNRFNAVETRAHFRSLRSTLKRHRAMALARLELIAEVTHALERHVRLPAVALDAHMPHPAGIEERALALREAWGLGLGPIGHTVRLVENHGVVVVRLSGETRHVDAFSCWLRERPYIALTDVKNDYARSRFDVAHEIAHLLLHHDAHPGDGKLEREADRFAAAFLLPGPQIRRELPRGLDWRAYLALRDRWGVSIWALVRRARDLSLLSEPSYKRAVVHMASLGWKTSEPGHGAEVERAVMLSKAVELIRTHRDPTLAALARDVRLQRTEVEQLIGVATTDERLSFSIEY